MSSLIVSIPMAHKTQILQISWVPGKMLNTAKESNCYWGSSEAIEKHFINCSDADTDLANISERPQYQCPPQSRPVSKD